MITSIKDHLQFWGRSLDKYFFLFSILQFISKVYIFVRDNEGEKRWNGLGIDLELTWEWSKDYEDSVDWFITSSVR